MLELFSIIKKAAQPTLSLSGERHVGSQLTLAVIVPGVAAEFRRVALEVDVGQNGLRTEHHTVVKCADFCTFHLFGKKGYVVRQPEKVLLEVVGARASLASNRQPASLVVVAESTEPFDGQDVVASDTVIEYHAAHDLKIICRHR